MCQTLHRLPEVVALHQRTWAMAVEKLGLAHPFAQVRIWQFVFAH